MAKLFNNTSFHKAYYRYLIIHMQHKNMLNISFFSIKYLRVILAHVKMGVNVQMLEILSTVNVLQVLEENGVRIKV